MNQKLKKALRTSFDAPQPAGKERFLKALRYPQITYPKFLINQFHYIRKRVWVFSAAIVIIGWAVACWSPALIDWHMEAEKIWSISAILPFLAMLTVMELYRSSFHRMAELETVCRFSLPQIIMARIAILGGGNFIILTLLLFFMSRESTYNLLQVITYLMEPYLITCAVSLLLLNHVRGRESLYCCASAACIVCLIDIILRNTAEHIYSNSYLGYWLSLLALSGVFVAIQICNLLEHTEDRTWSLLLTD